MLFHVPVKLQANQLFHARFMNDVCQIALATLRLQHNAGVVQLGQFTHSLRNGARCREKLILLFEVGNLPRQNHVVQQFGGIAVSENVALRFPVPLAANAFQHFVDCLIGGAVKLALREK